MPNATCRLCGEVLSGSALSLRQMPVCNRFTCKPQPAELHDLSLHRCRRCQLIQLGMALPVETVRPRLPWIKYREPDAHLDGVVDRLLERPDSRESTSFGVGPFDNPLLDRLERRGLRASALDVRPVRAEQNDCYPYLETWQAGLDAQHLAGIAKLHGRADIVCCRYLLEHCHDPLRALRGLKQLLSPNGVLIIEVPDCAKFLGACDYSFLWEEHVSYFVEATLLHLSAKAGYEVAGFHRAPGDLEDALVVILRPSAGEGGGATPHCALEPELFPNYVANLAPSRDLVRSWAAEAAGPSGDGLALFGIGHQAVMFANAMGLSDHIAAVVDDDPDKLGYFPPGFKVPVVPSETLLRETKVRACLFAVAPRIEHKIRDRLAPLKERGVEFRSIFAGVPGSLLPGFSRCH